jgi:hypothetical protein
MRNRSGLVVVLGTIILLCCSVPALSQVSVSAQLNGTVQDVNGAVIVNASITLREVATNQVYRATSNDAGYYVVPNLPPGSYELTVNYTGFAKYTETGIVLTVGQTATANVSLNPTLEQSVTVTGESPIEPTRTETSQVINTQQIEDLPVSGRLFTDFALLAPGVATGRTSLGSTFTEFEITQISFGGMRSFSNLITVDGADFINSNTGVQRATPPQESVQEFRVVNSSFATEYGRALGGIVNVVTKSGSNDWHGSLYEYFQNNAFDARSLIQPAPESNTLQQNQFGVSLGGPIKKDRTFIFANYEGKRREESPALPSDFVDNFAAINQAKTYLGIPTEPADVLKGSNNDYGFIRIDHQLTEKNRLAVRYNIEDARDPNQLVGNTEDGGGIGVPSGGRNLYINDQSVVATINSLLRDNLVNTVLVQYARRHYDFPGATGQPNLDIPNDLSFGHNFGTLDAIYETRAQFSDTLGWVKGNHYLKFGYDSNYLWDQTSYPGFTPARIILPDLNCLVAFANFVDVPGGPPLPSMPGAPCPLPPFFGGVGATFYGVALARTGYMDGQFPLNNATPLNTKTWANAFPPGLSSNYIYDLQHSYQGGFIQDQWRVTPKLTLNYGLRYDIESGLGDQIAPYYGGVAPRVGFAFSPDNKTVIRGGFGIFFDRENMTFFFITGDQKTVPGFIPGINLPQIRIGAATGGWELNLVNNAAFLPAPISCGGISVGGGFCLGAAASVAKSIITSGVYPLEFITGSCPPACTGGAGGLDRNDNKPPYAEQASLEIDREVAKTLTLSVGYLFVSAHRLVQGNSINVPCPEGTSKPGNPAIAQGLVNPNGTLSNCSGTPLLLAGKEVFNGNEEFPNGGFLDYNAATDTAMYNGLSVRVNERAGNYLTLNANYTFSHIIDDGNFTTFINLPQNQFQPQLEKANSNQDARHRFIADFTATGPTESFARNFQFSGVVTLQSGRPFTLFTGGDSNGDGNPVTDRPGLIGRNTYIGDPLYTVDLRLTRYFQIREHSKLAVSVDAFNLLNRPNVDEVFSVYGSPIFCGPVPQHYKDRSSLAIQAGQQTCPAFVAPAGVTVPAQFAVPPTPDGDFGTPRTMFNPRQLQFSAKYIF